MPDQHEDLDRYDWMSAPAHLKTRRQLRAAGLRPNGQDVAALMVRERRGRRLVAHLYDVRLAAPKRTATPAQLIAVAKAVRGHQLAAALRRGFTEEQLTTVADPGDAWTTPVTPEKGNPMSNNETAEVNDKSVAIDYARYLTEQLAQAEKDARTPGLFVGQVDGAPTRAVGPAEGVALGKALSRAGVDRDTMGEIRTLVDTTAKAAAQTRMEALARREQWPAKVEKACADRDRAATKPQAQAASARGCRTRLDRSAARATEATADPARAHAPHPEMAEQGFER